MGKEDAQRGYVYWLVEPFDGNRIRRLVKSTHHQGAQALANTHQLSLDAFVIPVACSVATMHTALPAPSLPPAEHGAFGQHWFDASIGSGVLFCRSTSCPGPSFFKPFSSFHQLVGFYLITILLLKIVVNSWNEKINICFHFFHILFHFFYYSAIPIQIILNLREILICKIWCFFAIVSCEV